MSYHVENSPLAAVETPRNTLNAMLRGAGGRCPSCGRGKLFSSYLKVVNVCGSCGAEMHHQRADDAPPYFTMLIVGHVVGGGVLALEQAYAPSQTTHLMIWFPLTIALSLGLLPPIKGALIGLQWAQRMHGFGASPDLAAPEAGAAEPAPPPPGPASRTPR